MPLAAALRDGLAFRVERQGPAAGLRCLACAMAGDPGTFTPRDGDVWACGRGHLVLQGPL